MDRAGRPISSQAPVAASGLTPADQILRGLGPLLAILVPYFTLKERIPMTRILMIDTNQALAEAVGSQCLKHGIAVRFAGDLCEGLRHVLDTPVSLVVLEAARVRLSNADLVQLF